MALTLLANVQV